jgi:hypothetical protein
MRTITPMDDNFTRFLSYTDIANTPPELLEELFGIDAALSTLLPEINEEPDEEVIASLFEKIRKELKSH